MITAPLADPKAGMILFSERLGLMVEATSVVTLGFRFRVLNGGWDGSVRRGCVMIDEDDDPDDWLGESDFAEVLSVTRHEFGIWSVNRASGAEKLINRPVAAAPVLASPDPEGDEEDGPDPVHAVTLLVTVLGQGDSPKGFENWVAGLSLEDLGREMDEGELVGASRILSSGEVPPGEVRTRLEEVGNDGSFFEGVGPAGKTVPVATRISDLRDRQGWTDGSMEHLAAAFIREAGLERAFLAHLQVQADLENGQEPEGYQP